jgi:hypothetical protein
LGLIAAVFHFYPMVAAADASIVAGDTAMAAPQTADEILKNIRAIVDHGDLADEQFYAEKLGVVMKGTEIGVITFPDKLCGLAMGFTRKREIGQLFYYSDIPWYFSQFDGRRADCGRPYTKVFASKGLIRVFGTVVVDHKKICISESDVKRFFRSGKYVHDRGIFEMQYPANSVIATNVAIYSTSSKHQCVVSIDFYQNPDQE